MAVPARDAVAKTPALSTIWLLLFRFYVYHVSPVEAAPYLRDYTVHLPQAEEYMYCNCEYTVRGRTSNEHLPKELDVVVVLKNC